MENIEKKEREKEISSIVIGSVWYSSNELIENVYTYGFRQSVIILSHFLTLPMSTVSEWNRGGQDLGTYIYMFIPWNYRLYSSLFIIFVCKRQWCWRAFPFLYLNNYLLLQPSFNTDDHVVRSLSIETKVI